MTEITLDDLGKAAEIVKENTPCYCKSVNSIFCPKHRIIKLPKEEVEKLKRLGL